jgi:ATP-dependent Clp protease, protease subunit
MILLIVSEAYIPIGAIWLNIQAASMGLLVFMAGEKGRRVITPRTSILSHRFFSVIEGNHSQLMAGRKELALEHERTAANHQRLHR